MPQLNAQGRVRYREFQLGSDVVKLIHQRPAVMQDLEWRPRYSSRGVSPHEAVRLDAKEAPQREAERQMKESDDARAALEIAKTENKAVFRP
ncbi:MAG: hypothetical protein ND807_01140 [Vicinamibacterales bacterium]|nr:hypothetical protein [Vicinamibacterales bacterium]